MKIKKNKTQKSAPKKTLKFEDYKNCPEPTQLENEINHPEENKTDMDSLKEDHKQLKKR